MQFFHPIVTLSNGLVVANFSSPHEFRFTDGSVLEACSADAANKLLLELKEEETVSALQFYERQNCKVNFDEVKDTYLKYYMSDIVSEELIDLGKIAIDCILVPLPVATAIASINSNERGYKIARVCRVADRVKKTVYHNKFSLVI